MSQLPIRDRRGTKGPTIAAWIAVAWCAVIWVGALLAPAYSGETVTAGPQGEIRTHSTSTLVETNGGWILILLAIPIAMTLCAALSARSRLGRPVLIATAALLWVGVVVTGFSVGVFYLPAALALLAALLMLVSNPPIRGDHPNLG